MNDWVSRATGNIVQQPGFMQADMYRGHTEPRDGYGNVGAFYRDIAECDYHVCRWTKSHSVYDVFAENTSYVGGASTRAGAISVWKNHLISIGVHAECAVMLDEKR